MDLAPSRLSPPIRRPCFHARLRRQHQNGDLKAVVRQVAYSGLVAAIWSISAETRAAHPQDKLNPEPP